MKSNMRYIIFLTLVGTLGGLLFGYDTGVISGAEQSLQAYFIEPLGLGTMAHGLNVSSALIGGIIGGLISGVLSNRIGRKGSLIVAAVLFFVSALFSAYPEFLFFTKDEPTFGLFIMFNIYRIIGGIAFGLASGIGPMYISETSPANIRGRLVATFNVSVIFGMLLVYIVNWRISVGQEISWIHDVGWRYMFASETVPALLFFALLFLVPETPRYLILKNKDEEAKAILSKVNGSKETAKVVYQEIKQAISASNSKASNSIFSYGKLIVIVAFLLGIVSQFVGINAVLYYAPRIFVNLGFSADSSMLQTVGIGLVQFIFALITLTLIEKLGRKLLLFIGTIGMAIGMFGLAALSFTDSIGIFALIFILLFVASFTLSFGGILWVLASELYPNRIRGQLMSITVAATWGSNLIIATIFPSLLEKAAGIAYSFFGTMCIIAFLFAWKLIPETKGKTLEEIEEHWKGKAGTTSDTDDIIINDPYVSVHKRKF